jgi:type VI secretion system protein ImpG
MAVSPRAGPGRACPGPGGLLRVRLGCQGDLTFEGLPDFDRLGFFLNGDLALVSALYELLDNSCTGILARAVSGSGKTARRSCFQRQRCSPWASGRSTGCSRIPRRSFQGYQLLQEYFTFPYKFFFFELSGLERVRAASPGEGGGSHLSHRPL